MSDTDSAPAFHEISSEDHAAWVVATSFIFIILSIVAVAAKILYRFRVRKLKLYDGFILVATSLAIAETICIVCACKYGLGRHRTDFDDVSFESYSKFFYSAQILVVASLAFTKISLAYFIIVLSPAKSVLMLCRGTMVVVALWAISGVTALATQCRSPKPWLSAPGRCVNQRALYISVAAVNILTDLALVAIPIFVMWDLQTTTKTRWQVIAHFSTRIIVPVFAILALVDLEPFFSSSPFDPTWHMVMPTVWSQIMLDSSILTACIPSLKRVLDAFRSGVGAVAIAVPYELSVSGSKGGSGSRTRLGSRGFTKGLSSNNSAGGGRNPVSVKLQELGIKSSRSGRGRKSDIDSISGKEHISSVLSRSDLGYSKGTVERSESIRGLTDNVIVQTIAYEVEFDEHSQRQATLHSQDDRSGHSPSTRHCGSDGTFEDF